MLYTPGPGANSMLHSLTLGNHGRMNRFHLILLSVLLLCLAAADTALANKFATIGSGVSGASQEKIAILKKIGAYSGLFFILLGILGIATRHRFEGFIGLRKKGQKISPGVYVLLLLGALLCLLFFV